MRLHRLHYRQQLPVSPARAWAFFLDPANLARITPPWLGFRMTENLPEQVCPGTIISYRLQPLGKIRVSWITEITHLEEPHFFVDEQRFGPYRFWHHRHAFRPLDKGVEIEDLVHYALPGGPLGEAVNKMVVRPKLEAIFAYRRRMLKDFFGSYREG